MAVAEMSLAIDNPARYAGIVDQLMAHLNTPGTDESVKRWAVQCAIAEMAGHIGVAAKRMRAIEDALRRFSDEWDGFEKYAKDYAAGIADESLRDGFKDYMTSIGMARHECREVLEK